MVSFSLVGEAAGDPVAAARRRPRCRPTRSCPTRSDAGPPALMRIVGRVAAGRAALTVAERTDSLPDASTAVTW